MTLANPSDPRAGRDRRIIKRFSDARLKQAMIGVHAWMKVIAGACLALGVFDIGLAIYKSVTTTKMSDATFATMDMMMAAVFVFYGFMCLRFNANVKDYLGNESAQNLAQSMEKLRLISLTVGALLCLMFITT